MRDDPGDLAADDIRGLPPARFTLDGRPLPESARYRPGLRSRATAASTPAVGTVRAWLGLDARTGKYYRKTYTLKRVGRHIEAWLADDISFPATDCRKNATVVTDAQIADLVREFDETIYPRETALFSTPPSRDGTKATSEGDFTGDGDKTVTLIDNIRDDNFFDFPKTVTYTSGFFSAQLNDLFDRNVMTIDAYDWAHRLGAEPADDPTDDLCTSRPARPRMYEATFAHEWQHLLEHYADPDEVSWLNEGLSDYAQTVAGYVDSRAAVDEPGNDVHLTCFQGFATVKTRYNANPRDCGGPQNSLNLWGEGTPSEVLADYGNAYQFLLYLHDRFGLEIISVLHRDGTRRGLASVQAALPTGVTLYGTLHDYQLMTLVDRAAGEPGGTVSGRPIERVTSASLRSTVNLASADLHDMPGAAPNGADYVPLPKPLRTVEFHGPKTLPPRPSGWTVVDRTLFSGNRNDLDSAVVLPVKVPATGNRLNLETSFAIEDTFDWAYVTVSTDRGRTYRPVPGDRTVAGPLGPGLTGTSGGVVRAGYDLTPYAGKKVLLGLRYVSDGAVSKGGWRIGRITLGDRTVSDGSTLEGWRSPSAIVPERVHAWHVRLVGIDGRRVAIVPVKRFAELRSYPVVVAVVSYDEPTERVTRYAPYRLVVNGKLQPGGSTP